jgi:hypothetical protein
MKYSEAYDKIIQAYFKDEIQPKNANFCFCGTLCDGSDDWFGNTLTAHHDFGEYTGDDFLRMEIALFEPFMKAFWNFIQTPDEDQRNDPQYEDILFQGMAAALDVLKQIHIEMGEIIDETPSFTKRQLQTA